MKYCRLMIAGALWLAGATVATQARPPEEHRAEIPSLVRGAFDSTYGKALVAELGKSLRKDADPACLTAKGIKPDQLEQRGHELIIKWGGKLMLGLNSFTDRKVYEEKFEASSGRGARAELKRLGSDAAVKRSLELELPIRHAKIVDMTFELFDRRMLVKQIKLTAVSPLGTGNEALRKMNPTDAAEKKLDKFISASKSPALKKFNELSQQSFDASNAAMRVEDFPKAGVGALLDGVEADLTELCILPRK